LNNQNKKIKPLQFFLELDIIKKTYFCVSLMNKLYIINYFKSFSFILFVLDNNQNYYSIQLFQITGSIWQLPAFHTVSREMSYLVTVITSRTATTSATHATWSTFSTFIWAFTSQMSCFTTVVTWWFTCRLRTVTSYMTNTITSKIVIIYIYYIIINFSIIIKRNKS